MRGFSVVLRVFSKFNSVTADSSEVVGLNLSPPAGGYIFKPSYSAHCTNTDVVHRCIMNKIEAIKGKSEYSKNDHLIIMVDGRPLDYEPDK